jgi:hypothetical protein
MDSFKVIANTKTFIIICYNKIQFRKLLEIFSGKLLFTNLVAQAYSNPLQAIDSKTLKI